MYIGRVSGGNTVVDVADVAVGLRALDATIRGLLVSMTHLKVSKGCEM